MIIVTTTKIPSPKIEEKVNSVIVEEKPVEQIQEEEIEKKPKTKKKKTQLEVVEE